MRAQVPAEAEGQACADCGPCSGGGTSKKWAQHCISVLGDGSSATVQTGRAVAAEDGRLSGYSCLSGLTNATLFFFFLMQSCDSLGNKI